MRIFSKLMVIILLLSMSMVQAFPHFFSIAHGCFKIGHIMATFSGPVINTGSWIRYNRKIQDSPDAPEIITQFCYKKFKEHGLNPEQIQIKVKEDCGLLETFNTNYIVFSPIDAHVLKKALENPSDEQSINFIKIYSTFLDHEIAHIKNKDFFKRQGVLLGTSVLVYGAATCFINLPHINSLFQKPTSKKAFFRNAGAYVLLSAVSAHLIKNLYGWYARHQENSADAYAITHAKDPQALRYAAEIIESIDNGIINFLCSTDLNLNLPLSKKVPLMHIRNVMTTQYRRLKPKEDIRTWIKQQKTTLRFVKYILDVEHPSGFYRAEIMRAAANALEVEHKLRAETATPEAA